MQIGLLKSLSNEEVKTNVCDLASEFAMRRSEYLSLDKIRGESNRKVLSKDRLRKTSSDTLKSTQREHG